MIEYCAQAPPPTVLPATFADVEFEVLMTIKNKSTQRTMILDNQYIRIVGGPKETRQFYENVTNIQKDDIGDGIILEFDTIPQPFLIKCSQHAKLVQEIATRCRFILDAKSSYQEERNEYGQTELHLAVLNNNLDDCMDIMKGRIDINAADHNGLTYS